VDLTTGAAEEFGSLGTRDINGLAQRSDGRLVAYSHVGDQLFTIDPVTLTTQSLSVSDLFATGSMGGLASDGQTGFVATTGPNLLYTVDLFTGEVLGSVALSNAFSGIAVPGPGAALLAGIVGLIGVRRGR
jgi:hypothetical protein